MPRARLDTKYQLTRVTTRMKKNILVCLVVKKNKKRTSNRIKKNRKNKRRTLPEVEKIEISKIS